MSLGESIVNASAITATPDDCPVTPLGKKVDKFFFINAMGEIVRLSAKDAIQPGSLWALFADATATPGELCKGHKWLVKAFPAPTRRGGASKPALAKQGAFNAHAAGKTLMGWAASGGVYSGEGKERLVGVWRDEARGLVVHTGDRLLYPRAPGGKVFDIDAGRRVGAHLYPRAPRIRALPADEPASASAVQTLLFWIAGAWGWQRDHDPDLWLGWIGHAFLGGFPDWRTHLWVSGLRGSGKSTLSRLAREILGGATWDIPSGFSEASVRQEHRSQAMALLFDESEKGPKVARLIELLRGMSDRDGATVTRGGSDHEATKFRMVGAVCLTSILPVTFAPQDRSRFVVLNLGAIPKGKAADYASAVRLAETLSRGMWRRAINAAPRWGETFNYYRKIILSLGGEERDADTLGAVLSGRDILLYDTPPDAARGQEAAEIAADALRDGIEASQTAGEADSCWGALMTSTVRDANGRDRTVGALLSRSISAAEARDEHRESLRNIGLTVGIDTEAAPPRPMVLMSAAHTELSRIMGRATPCGRWGEGGYVTAMSHDPDVRRGKPLRTINSDSRAVRPLIIPRRFWPNIETEVAWTAGE